MVLLQTVLSASRQRFVLSPVSVQRLIQACDNADRLPSCDSYSPRVRPDQKTANGSGTGFVNGVGQSSDATGVQTINADGTVQRSHADMSKQPRNPQEPGGVEEGEAYTMA